MAATRKDNPAQLEGQQLAIYHALSSVLSSEQAKQALDSWPNFFDTGGSAFNGLHAFARDVCLRFGITGQQRDLIRALNRSLLGASRGRALADSMQSDASSANPRSSVDQHKIIKVSKSTEAAAAREEAAAGKLIDTAEFQTFQQLMHALLVALENHRPGLKSESMYFLNEVIAGMPWSNAQQEQMTTMLNTGNAQQTRTYQQDQLKTFLGHFRAWMSDTLGESVSNSLFKQASQHTEKTLSGIHYPPRSFL